MEVLLPALRMLHALPVLGDIAAPATDTHGWEAVLSPAHAPEMRTTAALVLHARRPLATLGVASLAFSLAQLLVELFCFTAMGLGSIQKGRSIVHLGKLLVQRTKAQRATAKAFDLVPLGSLHLHLALLQPLDRFSLHLLPAVHRNVLETPSAGVCTLPTRSWRY